VRPVPASSDWSATVDAIVRRTPTSASAGNGLHAQVRLLALLSSGAPLDVLLGGLATYVETWAEGLHCTILLVDPTGRLLRPAAAPSLPDAFVRAIDPVPIGVGEGCCGTAGASRELTIVEDIEKSDLWTKYAAAALSHGLRACWSVPIDDDAGALLGTLALYYRRRRAPSVQEVDLIQFASSLAAFVIQRHRDAARLRSTDVRLEAAIWGTDVGLWESGIGGDYGWVDNWCERFDIDPCDGPDQERRWRERIHPDDVERYVQANDSAARGVTEQYAVDYRILTRNGRWRWLHERGKVAARDGNGVARRFIGVCFVVDETKRMEAALRSAEDRYELAVHAARLAVWEYHTASDVVIGNDYWHKLLGRNITEAEARPVETWMSDVHPDDADRHRHAYSRDAAEATGFFEHEFRIRDADGEFRWLLDRGRVVERAADGTPLKVVGIALDIDARKRMEAALRESEQRFRGAFELAAIGMAFVAPEGRWLRVNRALCEIVGYTADELLATTFHAISHADDLKAEMVFVRQLIEGSRSQYQMEKRCRHKDGHIVRVLLAASLVRNEAAQPMYLVAQIQDITAQKRAGS